MFNSHKKEIHEELLSLRMEMVALREELEAKFKPDFKVESEATKLKQLLNTVGVEQAFKCIWENREAISDTEFHQQLIAIAMLCSSSELQRVISLYSNDLLSLLGALSSVKNVPLEILQALVILLSEFAESQWAISQNEKAKLFAEIIVSSPDKAGALAALESGADAELIEAVQNLLFSFDDFHTSFDDRAIRELLKEINNEDLTFALAGSNEDIKEVFLRNLSERARIMIEEDIELSGSIAPRDIENAKLALARTMRMLIAQGVVHSL